MKKILSVVAGLLTACVAWADTTPVASVGSQQYATLEEALLSLPTDGTPVVLTLLKDSVQCPSLMVGTQEQTNVCVTFDLNGKCLLSDRLRNYGNLTLTDTSADNKGVLQASQAIASLMFNHGTLTLDNVKIEKADTVLVNYNKLNCQSGNLQAKNLCLYNLGETQIENLTCQSNFYGMDNFGVLNIRQARIESRFTCIMQHKGELTIDGGVYKNTLDAATLNIVGKLTIHGGQFQNASETSMYLPLLDLRGVINASNQGSEVVLDGGSYEGRTSSLSAIFSFSNGVKVSITDIDLRNYEEGGYGIFAETGAKVEIHSGYYSAFIPLYAIKGVSNSVITTSGGYYSEKVDDEYLAEGYCCVSNTKPVISLLYPYEVCKSSAGLSAITDETTPGTPRKVLREGRLMIETPMGWIDCAGRRQK